MRSEISLLPHGLSPVPLVAVEVQAVAAEQVEVLVEEEQHAARPRQLQRMRLQIFRLWTRTRRLSRPQHAAALGAAVVVVVEAVVEVEEILRLLLPRDRC